MNVPLRRGVCPGLSAPMPTGDGLLVRLMPVAPVPLDAFRGFCEAARRHGNGIIEVTARGSLQVRGLTPHSAPLFAAEVAALGIPADEGIPVLAGPLAGDPGTPIDTAAVAAELRRALAAAGLALSPKLSVVVDGCGGLHLDAVSADIRLRASAPGSDPRFHVGMAGDDASATWVGTVVPGRAVDAAMDLLRIIAAHGPGARAADILPAARAGISKPHPEERTKAASSVLRDAVLRTAPQDEVEEDSAVWSVEAFQSAVDARTEGSPSPTRRRPAEMVGLHPASDGTLAAGIGLAFGHTLAESLAQVSHVAARYGAGSARPAPDRTLLLIGVPAPRTADLTAAAERLGFVVRADDPRRRIAACPGGPACASGFIPAREIARTLAPFLGPYSSPRLPCNGASIHFSGCPKGCAHPSRASLTVVGTEHGCAIVRDGTARAAPDRYVNQDALLAEVLRFAAQSREAARG